MHETMTVVDTPIDEPTALRGRLAAVQASNGLLRGRVKALEQQVAELLAWPAFQQYRAQQEAATREKALAEALAVQGQLQRARVAEVLKNGFLFFGDPTGDGSKLTAAGQLVEFGRDSQGCYERIVPGDAAETQRRRRQYWRGVLARAEWCRTSTEKYPYPSHPGPLPADLAQLDMEKVVALCQEKLAELPNPDAPAEEKAAVHQQYLRASLGITG
jgi:hypothetical protein